MKTVWRIIKYQGPEDRIDQVLKRSLTGLHKFGDIEISLITIDNPNTISDLEDHFAVAAAEEIKKSWRNKIYTSDKTTWFRGYPLLEKAVYTISSFNFESMPDIVRRVGIAFNLSAPEEGEKYDVLFDRWEKELEQREK